MREIKFRAWDNRLKVMLQINHEYQLHIRDKHWEIVDLKIGIKVMDNWRENDQGNHLMQFTGLKDKNGKEIYEGDIVKWTLPKGWQNPCSGEVISKDCTSISEVYFEEGCFMLRTPDCGMRTLLFGEVDRASIGVVIGNIHENPELLTTIKES